VVRAAGNVGRTGLWSLMKRLRYMDVNLRTRNRLIEITDDAIIVETESGKETLPADTVVMAVGSSPVNELASLVKANGTEVITIGDAKEPRKISDAVREGFEAGLVV